MRVMGPAVLLRVVASVSLPIRVAMLSLCVDMGHEICLPATPEPLFPINAVAMEGEKLESSERHKYEVDSHLSQGSDNNIFSLQKTSKKDKRHIRILHPLDLSCFFLFLSASSLSNSTEIEWQADMIVESSLGLSSGWLAGWPVAILPRISAKIWLLVFFFVSLHSFV